MSDLLAWPVLGAVLRWRHLRTATRSVLLLRRGGAGGARPVRPAVRADQPGDAGHLDPLPRPADRRAAGRRQRLLPRLPDDPGARPRAARRTRRRFAGRGRLRGKWLAIPLFVGGAVRLRAVRSLGAAGGDGVAGRRLLRRRASSSTRCSAARRSASTSARSASSTSSPRRCRRSRSGRGRARVRRLPHLDCLKGRRDARRAGDRAAARLRAALCSCRPRSATSTARSASTACRRVRTTTSRSATRVPGDELADDRRRSSIGRLSRRPDVAALALLFTFGALLNAFAMTGPVCGRSSAGSRSARSARRRGPGPGGAVRAGLGVVAAGAVRGGGRHHPPGRRRPGDVHAGEDDRRAATPTRWCRSAAASGSRTTPSTSSPASARSCR